MEDEEGSNSIEDENEGSETPGDHVDPNLVAEAEEEDAASV